MKVVWRAKEVSKATLFSKARYKVFYRDASGMTDNTEWEAVGIFEAKSKIGAIAKARAEERYSYNNATPHGSRFPSKAMSYV